MVLGGLWHGAAWTFVFWGAFHGPCSPRTSGAGGAHPEREQRSNRIAGPTTCAGRRRSRSSAWDGSSSEPDSVKPRSLLGRLVTGWFTPTEFVNPLVILTILGMLALQYWPRGWLWLQAGLSRLKPRRSGSSWHSRCW